MRIAAGSVVIVTGASQGIGRALCLQLAPRRMRLVLAARDQARLDALARQCEDLGATCLVLRTNVASEGSCRALIEQSVERLGGIDVLVLNAGRTMWTRMDQLEHSRMIEEIMRVNYLGSAWPAFYALAHLKRSRGRIVAVASVAGLTGVPERAPYAASKHAMFGFFDSLRIELAGQGVSVTMIAPDFVVTEAHRRALGPDGRPLGTSPLAESEVMSADECARRIVRAADKRQRLAILSTRARLGRWLKLVRPSLVDRLAARAIRQRH